MVRKKPKEEVFIQTTGRDRSERIRGPPGSGNGKEKAREVVEVCMYMQPESSSKYKTAQ
jgi:hypothetical protein